jgi:hypothetical protein
MRILSALDSKSPYYYDIFELLKTSSSINQNNSNNNNQSNINIQDLLNKYLENKNCSQNLSGIQQDIEYDYKIQYVNKVPDLTFKEDISNTLLSYIGDEKILEVIVEYKSEILNEVNEKINELLEKITFDLTKIKREDVLQLKIEVYKLLSISEEPELIKR